MTSKIKRKSNKFEISFCADKSRIIKINHLQEAANVVEMRLSVEYYRHHHLFSLHSSHKT